MLVLALSRRTACSIAFSTIRWCLRKCMSMKSMMMIPPMLRSRIWRAASSTACMLVSRMVSSMLRLFRHRPLFTSMTTIASVWSTIR